LTGQYSRQILSLLNLDSGCPGGNDAEPSHWISARQVSAGAARPHDARAEPLPGQQVGVVLDVQVHDPASAGR